MRNLLQRLWPMLRAAGLTGLAGASGALLLHATELQTLLGPLVGALALAALGEVHKWAFARAEQSAPDPEPAKGVAK